MTPLGTVLGLLLLIILLYVVVNIVATAFKEWLGLNTDYMTYDKDLQVIQDLYASGYASQVDQENFVNFKAFEYAVLLNASEYIRTQGQERFSIIKNQGLYEKESKESKLPMVWEFGQTQSWGDIVLGDYKFRNWRVALKELNYYLQETPLVPVNVSYTEENEIEDYFKNE